VAYGVGIVGTGLVAEVHARALAEAEGVRLVSILSRSPDRAAAFAARHGCAARIEADAFLDDADLDIVAVCTPPGTHLEPALRAIEAGRHVLIEKPLEITLEGCDAIIEAAARRGVLASGIFQSRFHEAPRLLKRAVDEGRFGRLVLGEASVKWHRSQEYYDRGGWKGRKEFEAGAVMNQAIHAIDLLQWYLGPVRTVHAFADTLGHERLEVEDAAVAALRFANGSLGVIQASTAAYPGFKKRIEVSGTRGSAILEEEDLKFWSFDPPRPGDEETCASLAARTRTGGGAADPAAIGTHGHRRQYEEFASALAERRAPSVDAVEARKAVAIILAVYRSARSGEPVRLEESY
jgi:UDP-N-acetyl-2-amino-2-deoxyglucuronate dehydrogenase